MATNQISGVIQHLRNVLRDGVGLTDGQLLEDYVSCRDEAAIEALVRRHGPMVWGVCRRVLGNLHDAEDAFQATFLVLVRRAASISSRELLANWLYGVAHQTALKARATAAKRKWRETQVTTMPEPAVVQPDQWHYLQPLLDEELSRLPEKYRGVIVLCDLEGKTRTEAAGQLGCAEGTVASRLARARIMLARRLRKRGIALSGGALAAVLSQQAASAGVPTSVVTSTIKAASGAAISANIAALTEGVIKTMLFTKLRTVFAVVLMLGFVATGAIFLTCRTVAGQDDKQPAAEKPVEPAATEEKDKDKEAVTAWGKEIGGLQAGLGFRPGQKRAYHQGETATVVLRVRNVGKEAVKFEYLDSFFVENPLVVTDDKGKQFSLVSMLASGGVDLPKKSNLEPGKGIELYELQLELKPSLYAPGKFSVQYERVFGNSSLGSITLDPVLSKLATGKLELEIKAEPPDKTTQPKQGSDIKKEPRFVPVASFPSQDQAAVRKIRELLDAARIQAITVGSRGLTVNVAADKAKQARAILEKAVVDGTLTVQILDQLPMPKNLRAVREDDKLRIEVDSASIEEVVVPVAAGLQHGNFFELSVYHGQKQVGKTGGTFRPMHEFNRLADKIPQSGEKYDVEMKVYWFETDAPLRPDWNPESGGKYKVLVTRTLKLTVGPENTKSKDSETAWGKEVGGLQAGLSFRPGEKQVYRHGETATVVLRVRNIGKEAVEFKHIGAFFLENPPTITGADGKKIELPKIGAEGRQAPISINIAPGKEAKLYDWNFDLQPKGGINTIHGMGKFSLQCERVVGPTSGNPNHPNPSLAKLATGKLELEVNDAEKLPQKKQKEDLTMWGKEFGGLQAGLSLRPGEKRVYKYGEVITLAVRVRNVGKQKVKFDYVRQFLDENLPTVTNADGTTAKQLGPVMFGFHVPMEVILEPGKEIELESRLPLRYEFRPVNDVGEPKTKEEKLFVGTGKVSIQYERVLGSSSSGAIKLDPMLSKLGTGKLDLEVKAK